jgi:hypothetical protein
MQEPGESYFRFYLIVLAMEATPDAIVNMIASWCCFDVGTKWSTRGVEGNPRGYVVERKMLGQTLLDKYKPASLDEVRLVKGAELLSLNLGNLSRCMAEARQLADYLRTHSGEGKLNTATVNATEFWQAVEGVRSHAAKRTPNSKHLSWDEFRVLVAILSRVGKDKAKPCGWQEIQARAAGWVGKSNMGKASEAERARRSRLILTRKQIRRLLTTLENQGRFAKVRRGPRSWYSFAMNREELQQRVLAIVKERRRAESRADRNRDADEKFFREHLAGEKNGNGRP